MSADREKQETVEESLKQEGGSPIAVFADNLSMLFVESFGNRPLILDMAPRRQLSLSLSYALALIEIKLNQNYFS